MRKKLSKSPLTYVLAQIKISPIMEMKNYIPGLQERIRKEFPIYNKIDIQMIEVKSQGEASIKKATQWHFADKNATTGILLDTNTITIHTTHYDSFESMAEKFRVVLTKFKDELNIDLCQRIGIRYINHIHSNPDKYLTRELLGFHLNNKKFKNKYLTTTENSQETDQGTIKIKSSNYSGKDVVIHNSKNELFVPVELVTSADFLSFTQEKNEPSGSYAMLDIDHYIEKMNDDFEVNDILKKLTGLHDGVYEAFKSAITKDALKDWE